MNLAQFKQGTHPRVPLSLYISEWLQLTFLVMALQHIGIHCQSNNYCLADVLDFAPSGG